MLYTYLSMTLDLMDLEEDGPEVDELTDQMDGVWIQLNEPERKLVNRLCRRLVEDKSQIQMRLPIAWSAAVC